MTCICHAETPDCSSEVCLMGLLTKLSHQFFAFFLPAKTPSGIGAKTHFQGFATGTQKQKIRLGSVVWSRLGSTLLTPQMKVSQTDQEQRLGETQILSSGLSCLQRELNCRRGKLTGSCHLRLPQPLLPSYLVFYFIERLRGKKSQPRGLNYQCRCEERMRGNWLSGLGVSGFATLR